MKQDYLTSLQNLKNKSPQTFFPNWISLLKCTLVPGSMVSNNTFSRLLRKKVWCQSEAGRYKANEHHLNGKKARKLSKFMESCKNYTRASQNGAPIGQNWDNLNIKRRKLAEADCPILNVKSCKSLMIHQKETTNIK